MIKIHAVADGDSSGFSLSSPLDDVFTFDNLGAPPIEVRTSALEPPVGAQVIASVGDSSAINLVTSGTVTMDVATFAGSGIVFNNTYTANVTQALKNNILAAEQDIASHWSNSVTINVKFDAQALGQNGTLAGNSFSLLEGISYAQLKAALIAHDNSNPDAQAAVATLPSVDPSGGLGWSLPVAYARMLGLTSITQTTDDTVVLNTSYGWSYGQDVIGTIEHEITEGGMGRIGSLGKNFDSLGNALWSTMDLFRYSSAGVRDYTDGQDGRTAYFSVDGNTMLLPFNNQYSGPTQVNGGDTADYNTLDVFGFGSPGVGLTLSSTDLKNMNVLGWTPISGDITAPALVADSGLIVATGSTATITASLLRFDDNVSTHAQETYTVVAGPVHGSLLKSGVATSSFTQADIDNGLITYHESGSFSADSFTFTVTDAANNTTTSQQFQFQIGNPVVVEALGSTHLTEIANHFYLYNSAGSGPSLKYGGADVVDGQFGGWTLIGAEATSSGYDVAWKAGSADQYIVWGTDSNGNLNSYLASNVSGTSTTLESIETTFQQDLNGDGTIGLSGSGTSAAPLNNVLVADPHGGILTGGTGNDTFVFKSPVDSPSTIVNFASGHDLLEITADAFGHGLTAGASPTLVAGAPADVSNAGSSGYFIFDNTDPHGGTLYWDATGGSGTDATAIAHMQGVSVLHLSDVHLV